MFNIILIAIFFASLLAIANILDNLFPTSSTKPITQNVEEEVEEMFTKEVVEEKIKEAVEENNKSWTKRFANIPTLCDIDIKYIKQREQSLLDREKNIEKLNKAKEHEILQLKKMYEKTLKNKNDEYEKNLNQKHQIIDKIKEDLNVQIDKYKALIDTMDDKINNEVAKRVEVKEHEINALIDLVENEKNVFLKKQKQREQSLLDREKNIEKLKMKYELDCDKINKKKDKLIKLHQGLKDKEKAISCLSNYELNKTMLSIYKECFVSNLKDLEDFFKTKKNPSKKAAEFVCEFKEYIKELEIDNRKLRLALSQYVDDIEGYNESIKQKRLDKLKEYHNLSEVEKKEKRLEKEKEREKNQLEIGYAFERYYGYVMEEQGYSVDYWGIKNGKLDGGIDLIAKNKKETVYIQCKYWSKKTEIRENVISQLYGASLNLALQNGVSIEQFVKEIKNGRIKMMLATHTILSKEARDFADRLGIIYLENIEMVDYPMVKLVEGESKIYYIPGDDQYDSIIYQSTSKKYGRCSTCAEAESIGYRGARKWLGYIK